jgi:hypothetical protein
VVAEGDGAGANELVEECWKGREHLDARAAVSEWTSTTLSDGELDATRISYLLVLGWPTITTERRGPRGQAAADAIRSVRRAGTLAVLTTLPQPVLPHRVDAQGA